MTKENPAEFPTKIKGTFAVDSPIDIIDLLKYFDRELEKNFSDAGVNEAKFVKKLMTDEYGTPATNYETYKILTPFNQEQKESGNEKYLKDMAVRVYHEIDINWQLKNRRRSAYDANYLNSSEMINRLLLMGNEKAEFVASKIEGRRSSGRRHPHSWNIVDEVELIQWVNQLFN